MHRIDELSEKDKETAWRMFSRYDRDILGSSEDFKMTTCITKDNICLVMLPLQCLSKLSEYSSGGAVFHHNDDD